MSPSPISLRSLVTHPEVAERVDRLEIPFNRYGYDPYGVSQDYLGFAFTQIRRLYRSYFKVRCFGAEHIPPRGRVMLIGNHSGGVALDGMMVWASAFFELDPPRLAQGMIEKFLTRTPFASHWTMRAGQFTGLPEHAIRMLEDERLLMVFPEGARGTAKLYKDRYSLVRFGTGFMRLALQTGTPIVPFAFCGGGEAFPTIANLYRIGRLVGAPYIPVTAYGLPIFRPVPCQIYYGAPMTFSGTGTERDEVILGHVDEVKGTIARLIEIGVERRRTGRYDDPVPFPGSPPQEAIA